MVGVVGGSTTHTSVKPKRKKKKNERIEKEKEKKKKKEIQRIDAAACGILCFISAS